ncbi:MAG: cytidylate kinase-like family protein [Ruminococcaceae bacterium]|nr:cytidylate kinase-like family protein [Oscillospiraceae bacterium]
MNAKYITIEREYGSGGSIIARKVTEKSGIPNYGREILEAVSKKHDISIDRIEQYEETATSSFLYSFFALARAQSGDTNLLTSEGHIFIAEQAEIREMANKGSAVFLGHCACEALKGREGVIRVYIRGSRQDKINRIVDIYGISESQAEATMKRFDKKRANYYYANTLKRWDDMRNYDIILDSSVLGIEACADVICALFEERK